MEYSIFAHRGITTDGYIENTLDSLNAIKQYQCTKFIKYGVEFDVQQISSGEIVCYHDKTLNRLHGISKDVSHLTNEEVIEYKIPYLKDIFAAFANTNYSLDIEIKSYEHDIDESKICNTIYDLITTMNLTHNCIISSFSTNIVKYMITNHSDIPTALLTDAEISDELLDEMVNLGLNSIAINKNQYMCADRYISKNLTLMIYTLFNKNSANDNDIINFLSKYKGVVYITDKMFSF